jgi:hypothetical protein
LSGSYVSVVYGGICGMPAAEPVLRITFDYDSAASHPDPDLRDIAWRRENAVAALGTAASLAQLIFART